MAHRPIPRYRDFRERAMNISSACRFRISINRKIHTLSDKQFCHAARYVDAPIRFTSLICRTLRSPGTIVDSIANTDF